MNEEEIALRQEHEKVKECELLVDRMSKAIQENKIYKPVTLASHREFTMTSRLSSTQPIIIAGTHSKRKPKPKKKAHEDWIEDSNLGDIKKTVNMIELLKKRENEIAIEEQTLNQRINDRLSLVEARSDKVQSGHFVNTLRASKSVPRISVATGRSQANLMQE